MNGLNKSQAQAVVHHGKPLLVIAGAGCISGDTVIPFSRANKGFRCTIRKAFRGFHQLHHAWDLSIPTFVRSFTGERVRLHQIKNIVRSGKKQTYLLRLENGYELTATFDHLIFTGRGFVQLGDLKSSDEVACDSGTANVGSRVSAKRHDAVVRCLRYHPHGYKDKRDLVRVEKYRLAYEADLNGLLLEEFVDILKHDIGRARKLQFVDPKKFDVHHVDFDATNNDPSNLISVSNLDHRRLHASDQYKNFNHGRLDFVPVESVTKADVRMTYDIQCESPHHNFVASGMVIHNSGKTKTLTHRVAHLIKHHGILPSRLFVTTFTNKAADEMQDRLLPMIGDRRADSLRIGTFHSLCRRILLEVLEKSAPDVFVTPKLLMGGGRFFKSMMWFKSAGMDGKETKAALHQIGWWKNEGVTVEQALAMRGADQYYAKFYEVYQKQIVDADMIDFDDMLFRTYYELVKPKNEKFLARLQNRIEHILVDEGQDLNNIQFMLTRLFADKHKQVTLVADDWQCQPPGTMVRVPGGEKPIEQLRAGDEVASFLQNGATIVGVHRQGRKLLGVGKRHYSGRMIHVSVEGKETSCTPEHRWVVRWANRSTNYCVTYLMRKGDNFRVGWCQLFTADGCNHLAQRARIEGADCAWILGVHSDRRGASLQESIVAAKFGLTTVMFSPRHDQQHYDAEGLKFVFQSLGKKTQKKRSMRCLSYFGRSLDCPFYSNYEQKRQGRTTIFQTEACNLIPELMCVPHYVGTKIGKWSTIRLSESNYDGLVYSLRVEGTEVYLANDIVTHNCLYGFRGAKVKYLLDFMEWFQPEQIKLEQNYRSTKVIVDYGNRLIKNNKNQIEKVLFTENPEGTPPQLLIAFGPDAEAEQILEIVDELISVEGFELGDVALIYRTNSQSRALVDILVKNQIPHKVHSKYGFYDRAEIKDIVTYLRVCSNPYAAELEDVRRIINRPTRYLGHVFITKAEEYQIDHGLDTFWEGLCGYVGTGELPRNQQSSAEEFVQQINSIYSWTTRGCSTGELVTHILSVIPYREWLEKTEEDDDDEPDNDRKLNVDSILVGAARFPLVDDFLRFIESMKATDDKEDDAEVIHLMTIHKSKGLEFPVVFVVGCSDKLLPHYRAEDPEEERRCCYVAVTRAKERLFISAIHGKYSRLNVTVSPFITEMGMLVPKLEHRVLGEGMESRVIGRLPLSNPATALGFE